MSKSVFKPTIKRRDMDAVLTCMVSENIGPGEYSRELVKQASSYFRMSGGFALREFERSLDLIFQALSLRPGDRVLLSPLAPVEYYRRIVANGLVPVFHDVEEPTAVLSREAAEYAVEAGVNAVVLDSPLGIVPALDAFIETNIPVIEDVTASLGAFTEEHSSGSCGRFLVLRMEEDAIITAGGGTLVLARNNRALGDLRKTAVDLPENAYLGNLNASLAAIQLKHVTEFLERRRDIAGVYLDALRKSRHSTPLQSGSDAAFYTFPVILTGSIKDAMSFAKSKGVATRTAFQNAAIHRVRQENDDDTSHQEWPNARTLSMRCLLFPLYPMLGKSDVAAISKVLASLP